MTTIQLQSNATGNSIELHWNIKFVPQRGADDSQMTRAWTVVASTRCHATRVPSINAHALSSDPIEWQLHRDKSSVGHQYPYNFRRYISPNNSPLITKNHVCWLVCCVLCVCLCECHQPQRWAVKQTFNGRWWVSIGPQVMPVAVAVAVAAVAEITLCRRVFWSHASKSSTSASTRQCVWKAFNNKIIHTRKLDCYSLRQ